MGKEMGNEACAYQEGKSDVVRVATIRSVALFFTVVLSMLILAAGVLGSVYVYQQYGGEIDRELPERCDAAAQGESQIMEKDMTKETKWTMNDGGRKTQQYHYDHATNTLLINTPASNDTGVSAATIAFDYNRYMFVVNVHDENTCYVLPWPTQLTEDLDRFMSEGEANEEDVVELVLDELVNMNFVSQGEIPAGFLQGSSGTTVGALCGGRQAYWLEDHGSSAVSRKRRHDSDTTHVHIIVICCGKDCCLLVIAHE